MNRDTIKQTKLKVRPQRFRSALAAAQSDKGLHSALKRKLGVYYSSMQTAKTLIKLGECPGWPRGYKTFFVLNSVEHENLNSHKYKNIKEFGIFKAHLSLECYFSRSYMLKCQQLLAF